MNAKPEKKPKPRLEHEREQEREDEHDIVTEAGFESFPASDPPSYNMPGKDVSREHAAPTTAQLRETLPSGRTMSKTSARDPAAAPFDTDDEAAGHPASPEAVEQAFGDERPRTHRPRAAAHDAGPEPARFGRIITLVILALLIAVAVLWLAA